MKWNLPDLSRNKVDFLTTLNLLSSIGVTGAAQQAIVFLLWKCGKMTWSELKLKTNGRSLQVQALLEKGVIEAEKTTGKVKKTTYKIKKDILEYLNEEEDLQ